MQFDSAIEKTGNGFGIYFTKVSAPDGGGEFLVVDGFVEGPTSELKDGQPSTNREALAVLHIGDILTKVNGENCQGKEIAEILDLLRAACVGSNTLSFLRNVPSSGDETRLNNEAAEVTDAVASVAEAPKIGFMGALMKVKSKIRAEIDGDEEELLREQLEDERFEKQWLEEFEVLKRQYEAKWETCTYTADEFCGLLYRSSDAQQKEYLLQEYPTLMEAWKDARASSSASRVIPEWPAAKLNYDPVDCSQPPGSSSATYLRSIHCSQSLQTALECLRLGFMWRSDDLRAFSWRLDAAGISSCSGLLEALDARCGHFERNLQSKEYPRLSKTMLRALRESAQSVVITQSVSTSLLPVGSTEEAQLCESLQYPNRSLL